MALCPQKGTETQMVHKVVGCLMTLGCLVTFGRERKQRINMSENLMFSVVVFLMCSFIFGIVLYIIENPRQNQIGVWVWDDGYAPFVVFQHEKEAWEYRDEVGFGSVYFLEFGDERY